MRKWPRPNKCLQKTLDSIKSLSIILVMSCNISKISARPVLHWTGKFGNFSNGEIKWEDGSLSKGVDISYMGAKFRDIHALPKAESRFPWKAASVRLGSLLICLLLTSCPQAEQLSRQFMTEEQRKAEKERIAAHSEAYEKAQAEKLAQFEKDLYHRFKTEDEARKAEEATLQARRDAQVALEVSRQRECWQQRQEAILKEYQDTGRRNLEQMLQEGAERQRMLESQAAEQELQKRAIQAQKGFYEQ